MKKSAYVLAFDEVQKPVTDFLRSSGFKKSGRTYNRLVGDGLVHVINFQMGQYPIGNYAIPGIRESEYGKFVVNLGVYLPCVSQIESGKTGNRIIQEYDCHIRERLGVLAEGRDVWWSLDSSPEVTGNLMVSLLQKFGLPFLSPYTDYPSVLSQYRAYGELPFSNQARSALIAAIICHHLGDFQSAAKFFDKAASWAVTSNNASFGSYVEKIRKAENSSA